VEAFAAGVPVVATDVGGVAAAFGDAMRLVPAGNADAAATALREIAADPGLRETLVRAGHNHAAARTAGVEVERVAEFLRRA
jgi:D-inositol-3-phosphate glycosyltransferase